MIKYLYVVVEKPYINYHQLRNSWKQSAWSSHIFVGEIGLLSHSCWFPVTNPHIIRQRAPVASHHFALSTARKLFSLKLLLRSSFECLCWWKPTRKLGAPKTIYSQHPLQKKSSWTSFGIPNFLCPLAVQLCSGKAMKAPNFCHFRLSQVETSESRNWVFLRAGGLVLPLKSYATYGSNHSQTQQWQLIDPVYLVESHGSRGAERAWIVGLQEGASYTTSTSAWLVCNIDWRWCEGRVWIRLPLDTK